MYNRCPFLWTAWLSVNNYREYETHCYNDPPFSGIVAIRTKKNQNTTCRREGLAVYKDIAFNKKRLKRLWELLYINDKIEFWQISYQL